MLRTVAGLSAWKGMPPASEMRPITGTLPTSKTAALDSGTACPLLWKVPVKQTPLA